MDLCHSREWLLVKRFLDDIRTQQEVTLETSDSLENLLRAQGAKKVYNELEKRILQIVGDAQQEEEEQKNG